MNKLKNLEKGKNEKEKEKLKMKIKKFGKWKKN